MVEAQIAWQASLLDAGEPRPDLDFTALRRVQLDETSWVDYAPGWLAGADALFDELLRTGEWAQRTRHLYDQRVLEPRLTAGWSVAADASDVPPALRSMAVSLSGRYDVRFDSIWVNLYRDGRDSVAWHGDRNGKVHSEPLVGTVSLGARRRFHLRRRGTSRIVQTFEPAAGDLIVMGGRCQHDFEHTAPKTARAVGPRMSVTIRHSEGRPLVSGE